MPNEDVDARRIARGPFDGRRAFHAHLHAALAAAAQQNWREIVLSDPDFADWPLGERAVAEALQAWSAAGRSFVLLAQRFDVFEREHARFVHWRRMWSHIVECRACDGPGLPQVPSAHLDAVLVPAPHRRRAHAAASAAASPRAGARCARRIDECLRHARPAFPASTLGL